ncbi:transmembrane and TPR repeat-containing protein 3 [Trichonephila clavipes]|nr:transmembrane and TPR repeat-containing protein 3 [Trichonephila clavipes]
MWFMVAQQLTQITPPAARFLPPDQLWVLVEAAWSAVRQEHIQSLFESMPRRVAAVISYNAGYSGRNHTSQKLNHIFCGLSSWSYHLVNVSLHTCVSLLVTFLCLEVLQWSREDSATAALLFATHPIHTEAVSSAVGRAEVLSALFFLSSLLAFVKNEKVSNHGSIPITIDCNVVAFIVFEEGFHQPIKRTKQSVFLDVTVFRHTLVD